MMNIIKTYEMKHSNILRINSDKEVIKTNPAYQRNGEIWTKEKRQLLIDSILNDYDIPKLYFHLLKDEQKSTKSIDYEYAIIDGRR